MRIKYKPKIPASGVARERDTNLRQEASLQPIATSETEASIQSSIADSTAVTKDVSCERTTSCPEQPLSATTTTTTTTVHTASSITAIIAQACEVTGFTPRGSGICSVNITSSSTSNCSNSLSVSTGSCSATSSTRSHHDIQPPPAPTVARITNSIRNSSTDLVDNTVTMSRRYSNDFNINSSSSFEESLSGAVQAESVTICDDDSNVTDNDDQPDQLPSHRYPSFVESLSSGVLNEVATSHRLLGLDKPADDELVTTSAVETTYRRRCHDESDVNDDDAGVFDSCTVSNVGATPVGESQLLPQESEVATEVEVTNDNEAIGEDDDITSTKPAKSRKRRKQPEPKRKRKGSASADQPAQNKKQKLSADNSRQKNGKTKEPPDVTKMTMSELTSYNPKANPMWSTVEARRRKREQKKGRNGDSRINNASSQSHNPPATQEKEKSPGVEAVNEDDMTTRLVPQLTVGEDGQIILNEKSLVVEATQVERELDSEVVFESSNSYTTSHRYSKKAYYIKNWDKKETNRFYEILSRTGTDFTLMTKWFPERSRIELKRKFKREEKRSPAKITQAMKMMIPLHNKPPQEDT